MSKFKKIMEEAIREAERVHCDVNTFRRGLKEMQDILNERVGCEPDIDNGDGDGEGGD